MRHALLVVALLVTASCSGHRSIVIVPPVVKVHTWTLPLEASNDDLFCAQTSTPIYRPCWTVGYLRGAMVSVKAE
jgi:hypothetical protein